MRPQRPELYRAVTKKPGAHRRSRQDFSIQRTLKVQRSTLSSRSFLIGLEEALEMMNAGRVPQLAQGLGFNLANAFAGDFVLFANLFEGAFVTIDQSKTHLQDFALTLSQAPQ